VSSSIRKGCTGILVRDKNNNILQARNQDDMPLSNRHLTLNIKCYKNNKLLFEGVTCFWLTGEFGDLYKRNVIYLANNAYLEPYPDKEALETITMKELFMNIINGSIEPINISMRKAFID